MTCVILPRSHPLDAIWSHATAAVESAQNAIDDLQMPYANEQMDPLVEAHCSAVFAVMALPARNLHDALLKMSLSGPLDCSPMDGIDRDAILNEALSLLEAATGRGSKLLKAVPGLLEGVSL